MSTTFDWLRLSVGAFLLYFGADWFVTGASALALALRIPQIIVGLTVVAYGTSAPEVIVGIEAALSGHGEVALGNVIGSNIANIGLIFGLTALVKPIAVHGSLWRRELPVLVISTVLVPGLLLDGVVARSEGAVLLALACLYTAWMVRSARREAGGPPEGSDTALLDPVAHFAGGVRHTSLARAAAKAAMGLAILLLGGSWFVTGAVAVAESLGMSERIVGLTIVAIGTSLPELVTSLVAAHRGHSDLALGNVIGSNIFNVLLCLGSAALFGGVGAPLPLIAPDLVGLGFVTALLVLFTRRPRRISRLEGGLALLAYAIMMAITLVRG
jgi:cation:H+ antiporter